MTWEVFVEDNDTTFRREYGIKNGEGEREVIAWVAFETIEHVKEDPNGEAALRTWALMAINACYEGADLMRGIFS